MSKISSSQTPFLAHAKRLIEKNSTNSQVIEFSKRISTQKHPFHLVDASPWPIFTTFSALTFFSGFVMYMQSYQGGEFIALLGLSMVLYSMYVWWRDIVREATFEGHHTQLVRKGLAYGMVLFIVSEIMFFAAFFWGFFHSSLSPAIEIGAVWPPLGITPIDPWSVPLWNTIILLSSGATVTWAHHALLVGKNARSEITLALGITILLAFLFTCVQIKEYIESSFSISDGIYGSTFFMATGFHGFHVFVGTIFLTVCLIRHLNHHFTKHHHFGFEAAAWYWHFVDVVWLFLFISIYWWGGS